MADWKAEQDDPDAEDRADDTWMNENEKRFLVEGIRDYDLRLDGRGPLDYRSVQIKTGEVNGASGSARVRICRELVVKSATKLRFQQQLRYLEPMDQQDVNDVFDSILNHEQRTT